MSRFVSISRRAVMGGAVAAAAGALACVLPSVLHGRADPLDAAVARLLPHCASARTIGLAYLAVAPGEGPIEALRARLGSFTDAEAIAHVDAFGPGAVAGRLGPAVDRHLQVPAHPILRDPLRPAS